MCKISPAALTENPICDSSFIWLLRNRFIPQKKRRQGMTPVPPTLFLSLCLHPVRTCRVPGRTRNVPRPGENRVLLNFSAARRLRCGRRRSLRRRASGRRPLLPMELWALTVHARPLPILAPAVAVGAAIVHPVLLRPVLVHCLHLLPLVGR